jgi:hypothetical protein
MGKQIEELANNINSLLNDKLVIQELDRLNNDVKNSEIIQEHYAKMKDMVLSQKIIYLCDVLPQYIKIFSTDDYDKEGDLRLEYTELYGYLMELTTPIFLQYNPDEGIYLKSDNCEDAFLELFGIIKEYVSENSLDERFALYIGALNNVSIEFELKYVFS